MLLHAKPARCQEALRMTTASQQLTQLQAITSSPDYYNLALGPVKLRFQGEMSASAYDNATFSETNRQSDISLSPGVNIRAVWPVTERNTLQLFTGVGYVQYLRLANYDHLYITPNSGLLFNVYVGDFVINFHDRFSLTENVAQSPTVSGTGFFITDDGYLISNYHVVKDADKVCLLTGAGKRLTGLASIKWTEKLGHLVSCL